MPFEVKFVADGMLPIPPLPDAPFAARLATGRHWSFNSTLGKVVFGEFLFDPPPSNGIAGVAGRQAPDRVEMIGQQHDRQQFKRAVALDLSDRRSQTSPRQCFAQKWPSPMSDEREEICSAGDEIAAICGHVPMMATRRRVCQALSRRHTEGAARMTRRLPTCTSHPNRRCVSAKTLDTPYTPTHRGCDLRTHSTIDLRKLRQPPVCQPAVGCVKRFRADTPRVRLA